ncbi:hypothetical protein ACFVDU_11820 [Streptomyces albidoflavus]
MYRRLSISCLASTAAAAIALASGTATAATSPLSNPRTLAHFDLSTGQSPENIALEPDGSALVSLTGSRQVARVSPTGHTTVLATLPGHDSPARRASQVSYAPVTDRSTSPTGPGTRT